MRVLLEQEKMTGLFFQSIPMLARVSIHFLVMHMDSNEVIQALQWWKCKLNGFNCLSRFQIYTITEMFI
jgi:hypothetical protein